MDDFLTTASSRSSSAPAGRPTGRTPPTSSIVSRIALNETTETSVSANNDGMRKIAMAAAIVADLFDSNLSDAAQESRSSNARSRWSARRSADLGQLQSQTGIIEQRVSDASDRIKMQVDLFERHIIDTEGVDPYEAANARQRPPVPYRNLLRAHGAHPATQPAELS